MASVMHNVTHSLPTSPSAVRRGLFTSVTLLLWPQPPAYHLHLTGPLWETAAPWTPTVHLTPPPPLLVIYIPLIIVPPPHVNSPQLSR